MKKILILLLPVMLWSCGNEKKQIPVVEYVNGLVEMYPNYRSNEAAEASLLDSIANHNHTTKDLEGVEFRFEKLIENPQTGERSAIFTSIGCTSDIENPNRNPKYLMTDINIRVLGKVDEITATQLDSNIKYNINGVMREWDDKDIFFVTHSIGHAVDFGTYILDDMQLNPIQP